MRLRRDITVILLRSRPPRVYSRPAVAFVPSSRHVAVVWLKERDDSDIKDRTKQCAK